MAGDRAEDLIKWRRIAPLYEGARAGFQEGYESVATRRRWPGEEQAAADDPMQLVYEAMSAVELVSVAKRFYSTREASQYAARVHDVLRRME